MIAGRRLMETIIVYSKIDVQASIRQIKYKKKGDDVNQQQDDEDKLQDKSYTKFNAKDLERELAGNKQLIKMTSGPEDGESSGSDSEPSADNLEEEEMAQVVPIKNKTIPKPVKQPQQNPPPPLPPKKKEP